MQDFSSSNLTVTSVRSEAVLKLGKRIVEELELDQSVDTLGRWMAHYVAELIKRAESADAKDQPAALKQCADAILELWKHRGELHNRSKPFIDIERVLNSLESLSPSSDFLRFSIKARATARTHELDPASENWFNLVDGIDYTAKILVRYCLARAAEGALDQSKEWVALAKAAGADDGIDIKVIHALRDESELLQAHAMDEVARKEAEDRIERLGSFIKLASRLQDELRSKLESGNTDAPSNSD